jgi:hypothetical protein
MKTRCNKSVKATLSDAEVCLEEKGPAMTGHKGSEISSKVKLNRPVV